MPSIKVDVIIETKRSAQIQQTFKDKTLKINHFIKTANMTIDSLICISSSCVSWSFFKEQLSYHWFYG